MKQNNETGADLLMITENELFAYEQNMLKMEENDKLCRK